MTNPGSSSPSLAREAIIKHVRESLEWYARDFVTKIVMAEGAIPCFSSPFAKAATPHNVGELCSAAVRFADCAPEGFPLDFYLKVHEARALRDYVASCYDAECLRRYQGGVPTFCGRTVDEYPEWPTCVVFDGSPHGQEFS